VVDSNDRCGALSATGDISLSRRRRTGTLKAADLASLRVGRIAKVLGVPSATLVNGNKAVAEIDPIRLVRAFARIDDAGLRRTVVALVETLAAR
jgi:hypothetical protein